jgi:acyl-CoA thioester hydrolase
LDGFPVAIDITPRFRDTDAMGHVNNAVYITYFEIVRTAYWLELTGVRRYDEVPFILAHVRADFRSPAIIGETLGVGMRVTRLGGSSFDAEYRIVSREDDRLIAEGSSVMVMFDYDKQATFPIPDDLRARVRALEGRADL